MKKVTLKFSAVVHMIDFERETHSYARNNKDYNSLTITGYFDEAEIELAQGAFNAVVEETE